MNDDKQKLIDHAVELISDNFGESTAKLYADFYKDKESSEIKASCKELLTELVGPKNAQKQLARLK